MRTTITKTVSMMLVAVMVMGVGAMPFRANAGDKEISDLASPAVTLINRINLIPGSLDEQLKQSLKALFVLYDVDMVTATVSVDDLSGVAKILTQKGISSVLKEVVNPSGGYIWVLQCESVSAFPVNIYGLYAPGGRVICAIPDESDDSAATSSRPSFTAPSVNVDVEYTQVFDNTTNTWVDVQVNKYDQSVTNNTTNNNHYWDVDNRQFWDVENNTYTTYNNIEYNPTTQTYNVQFTDNRSYTYQFYYEYTYITYIGSSAEYREAYKVYYELPDGRSSGDLTVDELKGISLQFDMVNYDKVASDTLTKALYPFDGNLDNESYFQSSFNWIEGASTEYLESPDGFGGSLYVNPTSSSSRFNIRTYELGWDSDPMSYTLQFRIYLQQQTQSALLFGFRGSYRYYSPSTSITGNTAWLTPVSVGSTPDITLLSFYILNGQLGAWYTPLGSLTPQQIVFSSLNVGEWIDITVCYHRDASNVPLQVGSPVTPGYYYFYVNGLLVGSIPVYGFDRWSRSSGSFTSTYWTDSTEVSSSNNYFLSYIPYLVNGFSLIARSGSPAYQIDNLRFVSTALYTGVQSFTPTPVPFSPNLVYVLPSVADLNDNTVAIMSQLPVSGYRVGGIRPTDPTLASGYIYMHIDGDFVDSVQQWNGSYWEEVTARLYTGIRWIPVTAFNVFTLEDMFDIIDPDADGSGPGVDSIFQYYLWWSGEWGTFQEWLKGTMQTLIEAIQASGGGGGSTDAPVVIVPGVNDQTTTSEITTENPDGSTTKTTIVSNAAGLVYSNSVTTYPTDANGNTKTITVYTDSSGVMYQTETIIDKDGNVTVTEPTKATGTLGSILKMITGGVMKIAGTVIEGFVTITVDGVKFIIESADGLFEGIADLFTAMFGAVTDFTDSVQDFVNPPGTNPAVDGDDDEQGDGDGGQAINIFDAFFQVLPDWLVTGLTLCFVMMIVFPLMNKIHF